MKKRCVVRRQKVELKPVRSPPTELAQARATDNSTRMTGLERSVSI